MQALSYIDLEGIHSIEDFEDVSHKRSSKVWQHFLASRIAEASKCKYCGRIFKRDKKGSTTQLKKHLSVHHKPIYEQTMVD